MGKGSRNHSSRYRIVVHSAAYMKQKKASNARKMLKKRQKEMREGNIFSGLIKGGIVLPSVLALIERDKDPEEPLTPEQIEKIKREGGFITKKLFVCHKCSNIMQFVEKII